jgi:hypothetical protein
MFKIKLVSMADCNKPEHLENVFSPEMNRRIEEWIDKNLEGTDFHFA